MSRENLRLRQRARAGPISVSALILMNALRDEFARRDIDPGRVAGLAGHELALVPDALDARITLQVEHELWSAAERVTSDLDIGLHTGAHMQSATADVLGYAMLLSPTLGHALQFATDHYALLETGVNVRFVRSEDFGRCIRELPPALAAGARHSSEWRIAGLLSIARAAVGAGWNPVEVRFQHVPSAHSDRYARVFRAPVKFGCATTELWVARADLDRSIRSADARLYGILCRYAGELVQQLTAEPSLVQRVNREILQSLGRGDVRVSTVGRRLGLTSRSLQRRLEAQGTTYQLLLDGVRRELAMSYLGSDQMSADEVAPLLGFARPSAFYRAFRRWTGRTPGSYRRS